MGRSRTDVVLITSSFLPRFGGVEEHVLNVARTLSDRGLSVAVWAVDQSDQNAPDAIGDVTVRYLPCPLPARNATASARFVIKLPGAVRSWWSAWRHDRPRVFHIQCFGPNGVWAGRLSRLLDVPLVVSTHGETFFDAMDAFGRSALLRHELTGCLARAATVTACSAHVASDLERFGADPGEVVVVPNGIDDRESPSEPPTGLPDRYLLALGRMVPAKGFDLLLQAYAAMDHREVSLVIAGDGPELPRLRELACEYGIAASVHFPGRLDHAQVTAIMARAELLVVPSRIEPFGIVILEGWRAGIPVVATSLGGPPEFVEDGVTGFLVDPKDTPALAARISSIVEAPDEAAGIARAGRAKAAEFSWDRVARSYQEIYDQLR